MDEIIQLTDKLRIRRIDRMNVTVEKQVYDEKNDKWSWYQANGSGRGPFYPDEVGCCRWVLDHGLMWSPDDAPLTLQQAVERYEKAARKLESAVRKAVAS